MCYFPTTPQVCCRTTFGNLKVQICCKIAKTKLKLVSYLSKNESFIHMAEWILLLSQKLLNSKCPTLAPTDARGRPHHSSIALSMTLWSTAAAKHAVNTAITFYDFNCLNAYN